jgi:hypothetical protein
MLSLPVSSLIRIEDPMQYTLHIARWNGQEQPLDIYANSRGEWPVGNRFPTDETGFRDPLRRKSELELTEIVNISLVSH